MAHIPSNDIHNSDFIPKTTEMTLYNQINDHLAYVVLMLKFRLFRCEMI